MVASLPIEAYEQQIRGLIPPGRAWRADPGTTLAALIAAIAEELNDIDTVAVNILEEIRPNTTFDLLPDWERVAGLPDKCSALGATVTVRRASLLEKLVTKPTLNISEFERIGRTFGVDIVVEELDQTRAEALSAQLAMQTPPETLDVTNGKWRFVWWITIPTSADVVRLTTVSTVKTPFREVGRNTEMECRLEAAAPAHARLEIEYNAVPQFGALNDVMLDRGDTHVLPEASGGDDPVGYSVAGLPAGVTFAAATRTLTAANNAALGAVTVTYTATDNDGDADSQTFQLTVNA